MFFAKIFILPTFAKMNRLIDTTKKLINAFLGIEAHCILPYIKILAHIDVPLDCKLILLCTDVVNIIRDYAKMHCLEILQLAIPFYRTQYWISIHIDKFKINELWTFAGACDHNILFVYKDSHNMLTYRLKIHCKYNFGAHNNLTYMSRNNRLRCVYTDCVYDFACTEGCIYFSLVQEINNEHRLWFNRPCARNCKAFSKVCEKYKDYKCTDGKIITNIEFHMK